MPRLPSFAVLIGLTLALLLPRQSLADERLADLVESVAPSVVNIHTTGTRAPRTAWDALFGGTQRFNSLGSGFVVDRSRGLVVTNAHVIAGASQIQIQAWDGRIAEAELLGADAALDLAVLRVRGLDLPAVTLGESTSLRVGADVFAVGNPYGHGHTVTQGILSARARSLGRDAFDLFLQTDAAINPGNSGGPLFDGQGRVIGVNTIVDARAEAIGFAMPIELVRGALGPLSAGRPVTPGWPGLVLEVGARGELKVGRVFADGPAARAGLAVGDQVVAVQGRPVATTASWAEWFEVAFPGDVRSVAVRRGSGRLEATLSLEARDAWARRNAGDPVGIPALRITVQGLLPDTAVASGIEGGQLVVAAEAGSWFRAGDVLLSLNGIAITTAEDVARGAEDALSRRVLRAELVRDGRVTTLANRW